MRLQQILFFRELDFPLREIKRIIDSPKFDMRYALQDQKKMIELKRSRLGKLVKTIDKTIKKINQKIIMDDAELYGNFTKEEMEKYTAEAKERWGNTEAFKQSQIRVKKMGKEGLKKVLEESGKVVEELAEVMREGLDPKHERAQILIRRHYDGLRAFYEPNPEMYKGLARMYVEDERFKINYERVAPGLAQYLRDGMLYFADNK